jgi:RND family efflux transporter MFP subunit
VKAGGWRIVVMLAVAVAVAAIGWQLYARIQDETAAADGIQPKVSKAIPVEVSPIEQGPMESSRTFSGTLEARAQFVVAPKVSGRIEKLHVHLADTVTRGQVVAELDNDEYLQAVAQAEAELAVAQATLTAARSALEIADRELDRIAQLRERGITTATQFDVAKAGQLAKQAEVEVAEANLRRAESLVQTSKIQLGYTRVKADWSGGQDQRIVAERFLDEGGNVAANASLLRIVELNPIVAVIFVTEKDYANLHHDQAATLATDAYPGERFEARIARIAPVFREETRQARVELTVDNPRLRLKPGMFIRATVVLERLADTISVPELALTSRDGKDGVFIVNPDAGTVAWRTVDIGIREGNRVQVIGAGLSGEVVTLGQQFLDDGSAIAIAQ